MCSGRRPTPPSIQPSFSVFSQGLGFLQGGGVHPLGAPPVEQDRLHTSSLEALREDSSAVTDEALVHVSPAPLAPIHREGQSHCAVETVRSRSGLRPLRQETNNSLTAVFCPSATGPPSIMYHSIVPPYVGGSARVPRSPHTPQRGTGRSQRKRADTVGQPPSKF
jgi:hypothetical protein